MRTSNILARSAPAGSRKMRRWAATVAAAMLALSATRPAHAGFTEAVPSNVGEPEQGAILSHALGGTFVSQGNNFSNGSITATQLDDSDAQLWSGPIVSAKAVAGFSIDPEIFGYISGTGPGSFVPLFTASGNGYDVTGGSGPLSISGTYQLARSGTSTFSSVAANNPDQDVHLLAYAITGLPNQAPNVNTWMLFWEDTVAPYSDWDFNDLVVELQTDPIGVSSTTPPLLIPLPRAVWSGLSGLLALLAFAGLARLRRLQLA